MSISIEMFVMVAIVYICTYALVNRVCDCVENFAKIKYFIGKIDTVTAENEVENE